MKIKTKNMPYEDVMRLPRPKHQAPKRPSGLFRFLMRALSQSDLKDTHFSFTKDDGLPDEPCLILMNHSCFLDLEIVSEIFRGRPVCIVCTADGFVGKEWLMRQLGCIPTHKFAADAGLIRDMATALKKGCHVLLYPEASYSFDGCATPLPPKMSKLFRLLRVPVLMVRTYGAFQRDPLYNGLQKRKINVSAHVSCLLTKEESRSLPLEEAERCLTNAFTFDHFAWQKKENVTVDEPFRADGLERILYACPHCLTENAMRGKGTLLTCAHCGKTYEMDTLGQLHAREGETAFTHIPDWYAWERAQVRRELTEGTYQLDIPVSVGVMVDFKAIYLVGQGQLTHDASGFHLVACDGKLDYRQPPEAYYSLYADYFWYEIGDVICLGDGKTQYCCFPQAPCAVAKARLATEELFRIVKNQ